MKKKIFTLFLAICMICTILPFGASAALSNDTVACTVTYKQTEARGMLKLVNDFRTGDDAWVWNNNDTKKVKLDDLNELTYDYSLEEIAMQRAVEIALSCSHTRPNNTKCFTLFDNSVKNKAENIAAGYSSAAEVFAGWQEANANYNGQGHRRNMLDSDYNAVGIACVYYNDCYYWVQEFGYIAKPNTKETNANDASTTVNVEVSEDLISSVKISADSKTPVVVQPGKSIDFPAVTTKILMNEAWPGDDCIVVPQYRWYSSNITVARVSNGKIVGVREGSATITVSALGTSYNIPVTVSANPFVDVSKDKNYYNAVMWAVEKDITKGFDSTHFVPQNPCTRAQVVTFLWRAAGSPEPKTANNPFVDVTNSGSCAPYYKAILWAVEKGITKGVDATHFNPDGVVSRAQFVTFLWRYEGQPATKASYKDFKDANSIAEPFQTAVAWAAAKNITTGYSDNTFRPNETCTRWAVALFMYRDMA